MLRAASAARGGISTTINRLSRRGICLSSEKICDDAGCALRTTLEVTLQVIPAYAEMGSFDSARHAPRYAQDDRM